VVGLIASEKFKPVIFVGLGGNGGKIVNKLADRLKRHQHWDRINDLTHFVVIDTNKDDLDKHRDVSPDCRFLISSFDNAAYVQRKRGHAQFPADPMITQWIPPEEVYGFRSTQGAGAGQIRMESRLRLYYNLENDRARIRQKLRNILSASTSRENPWRDNEDKVVRIVIYGSVAGGTGSGAFLPMAYLLRQMVQDAGWGRPSLTAVLSLPTTFINKVRPELQDDIKANGYAALKELEHLTRQLGGYTNGSDRILFHYDPGTTNESRTYIQDRPFDIAYLIDQPADMSIEKFEHAVADASYLQIFSPLLGAQKGEYDNYEKRQKQLASGYFSSHYGSFGVALLQMPRNDLIRYSSLRYIARAFREYLCFGGDAPQFRVPYGSPAFERLAPDEKNRIIDQKFSEYVTWRAEQENKNDERGVFTAIYEQTSANGKKLLREAFQEQLFERFAKLDELMEIPEFKIQEISEGNPSISRQINELRRTYGVSRSKVISEYLAAQKAELRNGTFLERFFKRYDINPIAQRLFLIRLLSEAFVVPFSDPEEGEFLKSEAARMDLDSADVQDRAGRINSSLTAAVDRGFFSSLLDRDNKEFTGSKRRAIRFLNELADDQRSSLQRDFWRSFQEELRLVGEQLLSAFRMVAEIADTRAREAESATESFRRDPGAWPDSDIAQYYLDAEVLRDDRRRERLWHIFFRHNLDRSSFFKTEDIFPLVTQAFLPKRDPDGQIRTRDASEIVNDVREGLIGKAKEIYTRALGPSGMDLDLNKGLELEQRYIALLDAGEDIETLHKTGKLDEATRAVSATVVRKGIEDKLQRLSDECVILAHVDQLQQDDPTVTAAHVFYAGIAARYDTEEENSIGQILRGVVSGLNFVSGWNEGDALVLYRAILGVPVYFFKNVGTELESAYKKVASDSMRGYPLHIEHEWDGLEGLPNLNPVEMRRASERRQAEQAARTQRMQREGKVERFAVCNLMGTVTAGESGFSWSYEGMSQKLADSRVKAFNAFDAMDPDMRDELVGTAKSAYRTRALERRPREQLIDEAEAYLKRLKKEMFRAAQNYEENNQRYIKEEREVVEALIARLKDGEASLTF
jgi:hypothetical protein